MIYTLLDLRGSITSGSLVQYDDAMALAKKEGVKYCETSALTQQGLNVCFDEAVRTVLLSKQCRR